ncbi:MAG: DNA-directed RNA polymerase subunit omega [Christensenellales bacterium]
MIYPPLNELMKKVDCRYTLVTETAKRARQIVDKAPVLTDADVKKPVTIAVYEIYEDKIMYYRDSEL